MPNRIRVLTGSCLDIIPREAKKEKADLAFVDPPFNIGQNYRGPHKDKMSPREYAEFTCRWVDCACDAVRPGGLVAIHCPDDVCKMVFKLELHMERKYAMTPLHWVNWHYRFAQCMDSKWLPSRCHLLVYRKDEFRQMSGTREIKHTWNPQDVLVESDRSSKYNDKRVRDEEDDDGNPIEGTAKGGERVPFDVWGIPSDGAYWGRVQGNNAERVPGCPNQLPEVYMQRMVLAYTNRDDMIFDLMSGSGTLPVVAKALGRRCVAADLSKENTADIRKRLRRGPVRIKPE